MFENGTSTLTSVQMTRETLDGCTFSVLLAEGGAEPLTREILPT